MESSDTETGMVDCSVGTIVWVRRRNGSWWPGKILGSEELSASHLMSPRSGTPVKLLGREDASVDWYNLEKSKRVKPFRCGVFDDCIERAEASQGMPPKKREKYARREDAILHALELEKQLLEKKCGKVGLSSNGASAILQSELRKETSPELACDSGKHSDSKINLSPEDKKKGISLQAQRVEKGSQLGVDDENSDVQPRMRGLQDIGLSSVPPIHKLASNGSHKYAPDDGIHAHLGNLAPKNSSPINSKHLLEKRKRSNDGYMEESPSKRRDRRRPLIQVLESSAKLPHQHSSQLQADGGSVATLVLEEDAKGGNDAEMAAFDNKFDRKEALFGQMGISTSKSERRDVTYPVGLIEQQNSESTEDTETDSSGTESLESDTDDAMAALSDEAEHIELIPKSFGRSEPQGNHESMSDEDVDYLGYHDDTRESQLTNATVSKWQLKGKRNNRNLTKRYPDASNRKTPIASFQETRLKEEETYHYDNYESIRIQGNRDIINWDDFTFNDHFECYDPLSEGHHLGRRILIDVELKVQSGYQREHVPMISLMSKLNGKAIVGHPIPVETLENGTSESILLAESESLDYDTPLQPWRTARRTAKCRVPRPPLLTLDEEDEDSKAITKLNAPVKVVKKGQKKMSSSSSQKIRALSSIGAQQKESNSNDVKAESSSGYEVMKPELLPTAVACIPVKLVFSRLHEELGARHQ